MAKDELQAAVIRSLMECGVTAENYAKIAAPVDTGYLRNSGGHRMKTENTVAIGFGADYAKYQELGTSRGIKPKRFLTNALLNHLGEYETIIRNNLK